MQGAQTPTLPQCVSVYLGAYAWLMATTISFPDGSHGAQQLALTSVQLLSFRQPLQSGLEFRQARMQASRVG
jgi:hypothetical protein